MSHCNHISLASSTYKFYCCYIPHLSLHIHVQTCLQKGRDIASNICCYPWFSFPGLPRRLHNTNSQMMVGKPRNKTLSDTLLAIITTHSSSPQRMVGGLPDWIRLWCVMRQHHLRCWTYPEDVGRRMPIHSFDLTEVQGDGVVD